MPATSTQSWFVSRWTPFCFPFILNGPVDVDRLRSACRSLVHQRSILRTVFTWGPSSQLLYVTLSQLKPFPFRQIHIDQSPVTIAQAAITEVVHSYAPELHQFPIEFTLYSQSPGQHLFLVRLSHAQFDGYCLSILFKELGTAYLDSRALPVTPQFSDYIKLTQKRNNGGCLQAAITFWTTYLEGSTMTALPSPSVPSVIPSQITHEKVISPLPKTSDMAFTFPTVVNAALSFLLSRWVQKKDLVFGLVMNTRDKPGLEHSDRLIGPCLSINPLRLRIQPGWTVTDLCHAAKLQFLEMTAYDDLNWPDLVAQCTRWAPSTEFGCILNHLTTFGDQLALSLGDDTSCQHLPMYYEVKLPNQLLLRSIYRENHSWEIQLLAPSALMDAHMAKCLGNRLSQLVHQFYQLPNRLLSCL